MFISRVCCIAACGSERVCDRPVTVPKMQQKVPSRGTSEILENHTAVDMQRAFRCPIVRSSERFNDAKVGIQLRCFLTALQADEHENSTSLMG